MRERQLYGSDCITRWQGKFLWILTRLDEYYFGKGLVYSRLKDEKRSYFAEKGEQMGPDLIADR
jgi:hypothetical protein